MGRATTWLVGMMGAGKTEVGRRLALRTGRPFVDTDAWIEDRAGKSVSAIFAEEGEAGFRVREREAIEAVRGSRAIVALGGGAIAQPGIADLLLASGRVAFLRAKAETLLERIGDPATRPLLAELSDDERLARLRGLLEDRSPSYARADLVVDTDGRAPDAIVDELLAQGLCNAEPA